MDFLFIYYHILLLLSSLPTLTFLLNLLFFPNFILFPVYPYSRHFFFLIFCFHLNYSICSPLLPLFVISANFHTSSTFYSFVSCVILVVAFAGQMCKAIIGLVMSVRTFVHMEQRDAPWTDFRKMSCLRFFTKISMEQDCNRRSR